MAVDLQAAREQIAEVGEQLQVVLDHRVSPYLRRVGHGGVAGGDERGGVGALHAAVGRVGVAVLEAQVGKPVAPIGRPTLPATVYASPSPAR